MARALQIKISFFPDRANRQSSVAMEPSAPRHDAAPLDRNLGEQPIARILRERNLKPHDLVAASSVPLTHKMVSRACKGRWLTPNTRTKVLDALNRATGRAYSIGDLFNY